VRVCARVFMCVGCNRKIIKKRKKSIKPAVLSMRDRKRDAFLEENYSVFTWQPCLIRSCRTGDARARAALVRRRCWVTRPQLTCAIHGRQRDAKSVFLRSKYYYYIVIIVDDLRFVPLYKGTETSEPGVW